MITIIYGKKGSGKTKKILDMANGILSTTRGDAVFLAATSRYRTEIKPQIKFIDTAAEGICTKELLVGFLKGLICGNYDIEYIFIDGFYKMMRVDLDSPETEEFFKVLEDADRHIRFVLTVSCDKSEMPGFIAKHID